MGLIFPVLRIKETNERERKRKREITPEIAVSELLLNVEEEI